jgi:hypothetical protein
MADRKNVLAPQPINALIDRASQQPVFQEITGYLGPAMPKFRYGGGAELMGASGQFNPLSPREIVLAERFGYGANSAKGEETAIHELTHAAINKMHWDYQAAKKKRKSDPTAAQFADAYEKLLLRPDFASQMSAVANRMDPQWVQKNKSYRATSAELPASAVGVASTGTADEYNAPLHLNPTLATQFRVLLDLANRVKTK